MTRVLNWKLALVAASIGTLLCSSAHADTIIAYTFSDDASFSTAQFPTPFSISGTFDYDVNTPAMSTIDVLVARSAGGGVTIPFPFSSGAIFSPFTIEAVDPFAVITFDFSNSLALGSADPLVGVTLNGFTASSFTGSALTTSAPEPITLSIFGAGLVGAVAMRRRKAKRA